jgi:hypothetical protein
VEHGELTGRTSSVGKGERQKDRHREEASPYLSEASSDIREAKGNGPVGESSFSTYAHQRRSVKKTP